MIVTPALMSSAFLAAVRLLGAADRAAAQHLRDRALRLPSLAVPPVPSPVTADEIAQRLDLDADFADLIAAKGLGPLVAAMQAGDTAALARMALESEAWSAAQATGALPVSADDIVLDQWAGDENRPLAPWARFALVFADVALETAGTPGLMGGSRGAVLAGAFAGAVARLIPDDEAFGPRAEIGARLMGTVMRAGLETVDARSAALLGDAPLRAVVDGLTAPLLDAIPADWTAAAALRWDTLGRTLIGPAASAAFAAVARDPSGLLGERFEANGLLGALTRDLLATAADAGLRETLSPDGLLRLWQAALGVAASRPDLLVTGTTPRAEVLRTLAAEVARLMRDDPLGLGPRTVLALAETALTTLAAGADSRFADADGGWETVAAGTVARLFAGLARGLGADAGALFSAAELRELVRLIAAEAARHPAMLTGGAGEFDALVAAVAAAVAQDPGALLSGADRLAIVRTALTEAGRNPGRLAGLVTDDPRAAPVARLVGSLLRAAAATPPRAAGGVLFGETLASMAEVALAAAASDPAGTAAALGMAPGEADRVGALVTQIGRAVAATRDGARHFGHRDALRLFRVLLPRVLAGEAVPALLSGDTLDDDAANRILALLVSPAAGA